MRSSKYVESASLTDDPVGFNKRNICSEEHKGSFLKACPGTKPGYLCCNYYVLNIQTNCDLDCHYCIMQSYINNGKVNIYTNIEDALKEIKIFLDNKPKSFFRIGTGELTDSLSLDYYTKFSFALVPFFAKISNAVLELKTKSDKINNLLRLNPKGNTIVSWSLNPQSIIDLYEQKTASLHKRLESAKKCLEAGYRIGLHFDPVILFSGWEKEYRNVVDLVFEHISCGQIVWISIAGFRYPQSLKTVIRERFPNTKLFTEEMVRAKDGKYRYLRPVRVRAYRQIINWIREYDSDVPIYFCMESPAVWRDVFGVLPSRISNLKGIFGSPVKPVRLFALILP